MKKIALSCYKSVGEKVPCKYCTSASIKHGKTSNGTQRYRCSVCKKSFLTAYQNKACNVDINNHIVHLLIEGMGIRSMGRYLGISVSTVIKRILRIASRIRKPIIVARQKYEMDELRTYVKNKKNPVWVAYAISKDTSEVVDYRVGDRTNKTLRPVIDTLLLAKPKYICTDGLLNYRYIIPKPLHRVKKSAINSIERMNLNLRTHLKRLSRKTLCYSKAIYMLDASLKIYFWYNHKTQTNNSLK